jgi:hypothetical protein
MRRTCMVLAWAAVSFVPSSALAQRWEVEVHGGWLSVPEISGGTTSLPAPGATFTTFPGVVGGPSSRRVSSWLFGDGSQLLNSIVGSNPGFNQPQRITPLDSVLNNPLADRKSGGNVGFRVSRDLTPRFTAEFNFDYAQTPIELRAGVQSGLDTTTGSFRTVFQNDLFLPPLTFVGKTVTASNSVQVEDGSEILTTGAIRVNLLTHGRFRPYVTGGAGVVKQRGSAPTASATGAYSFQLTVPGLGSFPMSERDVVAIRQTFDESMFVGLVGGGVHIPVNQRSGIRFDVRAHLGSTTDRTLVSATPNVAVAAAAFQIASFTNPSLSFSSFAQNIPVPPSSLSGPTITDFTTFDASKTRTHTLVAFGYYFRF